MSPYWTEPCGLQVPVLGSAGFVMAHGAKPKTKGQGKRGKPVMCEGSCRPPATTEKRTTKRGKRA